MNDISKRIDYLIECYKSGREEILSRIERRDNILKLQLFVQIILVALAGGIKIAGVEASQPLSIVLILSIPASLIFVSIYTVEDELVGHLSQYLKNLSAKEAELSNSENLILNSDSASELQIDYLKKTLPIRIAAQTMSFCIIPIGLTFVRFYSFGTFQNWSWLNVVELAIHFLILIVIVYLLVVAYKIRKETFSSKLKIESQLTTLKRTESPLKRSGILHKALNK